MAGFVKTTGKTASSFPSRKQFKYPGEDETYVRRIGSALLSAWPALQQKILAEANVVWDREYNVSNLPQKLENFVKRHPGRVG
jgi:hypothetical protein